jgi:hypothetical protein
MATGFKTGGRRAGTPNKVTNELRTQLQRIAEQALAELPDTLAAMEPADRAKLLLGILPFVLPKLSAIDLTRTDEEPEPAKPVPDWLRFLTDDEFADLQPEPVRRHPN